MADWFLFLIKYNFKLIVIIIFFWEIIVYSWSTINACSLLSHKW